MPIRAKRRDSSKSHVYSDFRGGGLNLSASKRFLKENELCGGKNFCYERNSGRMRTLEPLTKLIETAKEITAIYSSLNFGLLLVSNGSLFKTDLKNKTATSVGLLNGTSTPQFCDWGEENERQLFVATGSVVQEYNGTSLTSQTPVAFDPSNPQGEKWNSGHDVMVREGRLLLCVEGKDKLKFSGIGDPDNWQYEDDGELVYTDADAKYIDIGYKEGGDIVKIIPVSRDLMVFRTDGKLYRLFGSYPDWTVIPVAAEVDPVNRDSIVSIGNDVMFLDNDRGIRKLSAVAEYDDFAIEEKEGTKVNAWLSAQFTSDARLWSLPDRGEIWVRPSNANDILCWSERYQGWTKIDLGAKVSAVAEHNDEIYVAIGSILYKLDDNAVAADIYPAMAMEFAPHYASDRALLDYQEVVIDKDAQATATFAVGQDYERELPDGKSISYQKIIGEDISPTITSSGGVVVLDKLLINISEVV